MKEIKISDELAYILQRMLVDEINNQREWLQEEQKEFGTSKHDKARIDLISCLEQDRDNLESQGLPKFTYYY